MLFRSNSSDVPAAGVAVVLDESSTIQDLQVEVVQNIAYLESASGLQPNIMLASEKVALAEAQSSVVMSNTKKTTAKVSTEFSQELSEAISEVESEFSEVDQNESAEESNRSQEAVEDEMPLTENGDELRSEEKTSVQEDLDEESSEQESAVQSTTEDETSNTETSYTETLEQDSSVRETSDIEQTTETSSETETSEESTDNDFETSAGFSALDTYDDVEEEIESETETETESETETETETQEDAQDFSGLVIARVTNYVNVRSIPSEEGEIVGKLYDKSVGEFIEEKDGWYKIVSGNCTGYVKGEYCVVGEEAEALAKEVGTTYAIVNTTTLKVRQEASTESSVLGLVPIEEELVVVEELDGWVKIAIEEGDGYVSRDYVNLRTDFVHAESREEEEARLAAEARAREEARAAAAATEASRAQQQAEVQVQKSEANQAAIDSARNIAAASVGSEMGKSVIDYATQFVGNPYVWGGSSLTNGTDCSGFVMSVYSNFGVSLPHSSSALRSKGYDVGGLENAQPGDIVCYSGHVGLYVGNGQIVHASTSKTGIIVSSATYRNILAVRRIF